MKIRCTDIGPHSASLTEGKVYEVLRTTGGGQALCLSIIDDEGIKFGYYASRFEEVVEDAVKRVICVDADGAYDIQNGAVYEVIQFNSDSSSVEIRLPDGSGGLYCSWRFQEYSPVCQPSTPTPNQKPVRQASIDLLEATRKFLGR